MSNNRNKLSGRLAGLATFFVNLPFAGRLFLLLLIIGVLPSAVQTVYNYRQTNSMLIKKAYENIAAENESIRGRIEYYLDYYNQISSILYMDTELKGYLTSEFRHDYEFVEAYNYINSKFYTILATYGDVNSVTVHVPNTRLPADGMFIKKIEYGGIGWILASDVSLGNTVFRGAYSDEAGERVFAIGRALNFNRQGFPYGYLIVTVSEESLYRTISPVKKPFDLRIEYGDDTKEDAADAGEGGYLEDSSLDGAFAEHIGDTTIWRSDGQVVASTTISNGWRVKRSAAISDIVSEANTATRQIILISAVGFIGTFLLIIVTARYFSSRYGRLSQRLGIAEGEVYRREIIQKQLQLNLLQGQINPHFLYNILSGISTLAMRSQDSTVSKLLGHLSQFYKTSLNQGREYITIAEEVSLTKHYIALQEMRFPEQFRVTWHVDDNVAGYITQKLLLEPFVENIIHHAQREDDTVTSIDIDVREDDDGCVIFTVIDDGAGIDPERLATILAVESSDGFGIKNTDERVKLTFGTQYGVKVTSELGHGTRVTVTIPRQTK